MAEDGFQVGAEQVAGGQRYRIEREIGRGAFGTVFLAEHLELGVPVALKVLNPDRQRSEDVTRRLRDEARLLSLLRHPAVVQVHQLVQIGGQWTVVMEYVHGVPLSTLLAEAEVPLSVALESVSLVAGALHEAYWTTAPGGDTPLQLLHRDIKPSNMLVTASGGIKVVDFGVARAEFESREARTLDTRYGSLAYMAPERMEFHDSAAGDVYALGAVLYELIAGKPLGRTWARPERHDSHIREALDGMPGTGEEVQSLLARMLAYEPGQRPTAHQVSERSAELRPGDGPSLADWAARVVPPLLDAEPRMEPVQPTETFGSDPSSLADQPGSDDAATDGYGDDSFLHADDSAPAVLADESPESEEPVRPQGVFVSEDGTVTELSGREAAEAEGDGRRTLLAAVAVGLLVGVVAVLALTLVWVAIG